MARLQLRNTFGVSKVIFSRIYIFLPYYVPFIHLFVFCRCYNVYTHREAAAVLANAHQPNRLLMYVYTCYVVV